MYLGSDYKRFIQPGVSGSTPLPLREAIGETFDPPDQPGHCPATSQRAEGRTGPSASR
jgi:hypothetical protein